MIKINGLSSFRRQAIIWSNAHLRPISMNESLSEIEMFNAEKCIWKCFENRTVFLGLNVLIRSTRPQWKILGHLIMVQCHFLEVPCQQKGQLHISV